MNPLTDIVPAHVRKYLYAAYALAGVIVGALAVAGVDVGKAPDVIAYLGIALGLAAAANTAPTPLATTNIVNVHPVKGDEAEIGRQVAEKLKRSMGDGDLLP